VGDAGPTASTEPTGVPDPPQLHRLAAFTEQPSGGNPAGVWVDERLPEPAEMQSIATEVGYSETAFVAPEAAVEGRFTQFTVRYYSPRAEVPFCGHATIAAGVLLGELYGEGTYEFSTGVGPVPVTVVRRDGHLLASLTSVTPRHRAADPALVNEVLNTLGWVADELDPAIPPALAYAGAWHLVLAAAAAHTLDRLAYDFDRLARTMLAHDLTTIALVRREGSTLFHARNAFPVGGVVEDPATGAAAAALGGYLRDAGLIEAPASFIVRQGEAMGRPSRLEVSVPEQGGIVVSGAAVVLDRA
jgi:PhzF family phenazine biosynthesis protein